MKLLFVLVLFRLFGMCLPACFKPEWHPYVVKVIDHHKVCTLSPKEVNPLTIMEVTANIDENDVHRFFLPGMIIWDPFHQFPQLFTNVSPLSCSEDTCDSIIRFMRWQDGSTKRYNPRILYGVNGYVLLICPIYCCARGHTITMCDPRILQHFPEREVIPFVLLHRCGITRQLQRLTFQLCSQGKSFSDIESLLLFSVQDHHAQQQLMYTHQHFLHTQSDDYRHGSLPKSYISNDLITNIFIISFNELKDLMFHDMSELTTEVISCDHTFKLATHIGIHKHGKWVPQYDSLFVMQDEVGRVLFWQLTMGTAYGSIQDGMESLKFRMMKKDKCLRMVIIDNCCMWNKKLKDTFGEQTEVKLDLFHAVKRITSALSKRHSYFYPAVQEFRLVFRSHGDNGVQRTKHTPSPAIILRNIDTFLSKWNKIVDNSGKPVITKAVTDEIVKLKVHIERGCLSGIPPHFGTNRNENLHRSLNKRLTGSCLGVEIAVALLATFFHSWNRKRKGSETLSTSARFLTDLATSIKDRGTLNRAECSYSNSYGIGVSSKRAYTHDNIGQQKKMLQNTSDALHQICEHKDKGSLSETVYSILHHAFSMLYSEEVLNNLSDTHCKVSRLLPCQLGYAMSWTDKQFTDVDQQRLLNILHSFDLHLVDVPANGDCLFTSIALYIQEHLKTSSEFVQHLKSLNIDESSTIQTIILKLRGAMVQEWLQNKSDYHPFFQTNTFEEEAELFRQSGMYSSSLGDAMLLGLANVLHLQFIVFTSIESWPHIPIHTRFPPLTEIPLYLAYLHKGSGHYSLARKNEQSLARTRSTSDGVQSSVTLGSGCRCGRGRNATNLERTNCSAEQAYTSRCPCLKSRTPCSDKCRCQKCGNMFGIRPNQSLPQEHGKMTRKKRPRHPEQDCLKDSGWKFMRLQNEQTISGIWTPHEHYVFVAIVEHLRNRNQQSMLKVEEIADMYESVRKTDFLSDTLSLKTTSQVKAKLDQLLKEEDVSTVCGSINYLAN